MLLSEEIVENDRFCVLSVLSLIQYHIPKYVTAHQCIFQVAVLLILMGVVCRRNDVFLHVMSPLQHHNNLTPRHPHCYSLLSCWGPYTVPVPCCHILSMVSLFFFMVVPGYLAFMCVVPMSRKQWNSMGHPNQ